MLLYSEYLGAFTMEEELLLLVLGLVLVVRLLLLLLLVAEARWWRGGELFWPLVGVPMLGGRVAATWVQKPARLGCWALLLLLMLLGGLVPWAVLLVLPCRPRYTEDPETLAEAEAVLEAEWRAALLEGPTEATRRWLLAECC